MLADLWSLVVPTALALCAALVLLSLLAGSFARRRARTPVADSPVADSFAAGKPVSTFDFFGFPFTLPALPLAPVLLLLALWLSPQTIATTATLLVRQSPEALRVLFLFAPLALFFLWCESSSVAGATAKTTTPPTPTTPLERFALRVFGDPAAGNLAYNTARVCVMLFALCCLLSLLLDLVPTLANLFWHQAAHASLHAPLPITASSFVSILGMVLLLVLALPQFFPQPNKAIAWMLLLLLPCVLLFYGALCLVAIRKASAIASLPLATESSINADTLLATLGIFRPAFGWLALLCCVPYAVPKPSAARKAATALSLCLAFACLLGFVGMTAAPVVLSQTWLLDEQGLKPLLAAFVSLYPNEGWLLEASLAALSATTLLALSALTRAALALLHKKAPPTTLALLMLATTLGLLAGSGNEGSQAVLLLALQHTQGIGQLAQGVATLLFVAALCALALRSLATLVTLPSATLRP